MVHLFEGSNLGTHVGACEADEGAFVTHLVAVVGRAEHSKHLSALLVLVALGLNFMTAHQQGCKQ